jgi:small subunit ribosomal protein S3
VGQKVNANGFRLGINKTWHSRWYASPREFADLLHEDLKIRKIIKTSDETKGADIADVEIIRHPQRVTVVIHTARPGVIIGSKGANIELINNILQKVCGKKVQVKIKDIKRPETNASLIAQSIAKQLKGRAAIRKVVKTAISNAMKAGAQGIKIKISGRIGGAEMSRTQQFKEGRVPLHTLRANIDYALDEAFTTFGAIGCKVWICQGESLKKDKKEDAGQLVRKPREKTAAGQRS